MSGLASMHEVNASDLKPQPPEHLLDGRLLLATDGSASADGAAGLLVVDLSNPAQPAPLAAVEVDGGFSNGNCWFVDSAGGCRW